MDNESIERQLNDLIVEIGALPPKEQAKLEKLTKETQTKNNNLQKSFHAIQESMDFLRLSIKYILFDLEATRRENKYLRKMLDEDNGYD